MTERVFIYYFLGQRTHIYTVFKYTRVTLCILCEHIHIIQSKETTSFIEEINAHLCTDNNTYLNKS